MLRSEADTLGRLLEGKAQRLCTEKDWAPKRSLVPATRSAARLLPARGRGRQPSRTATGERRTRRNGRPVGIEEAGVAVARDLSGLEVRQPRKLLQRQGPAHASSLLHLDGPGHPGIHVPWPSCSITTPPRSASRSGLFVRHVKRSRHNRSRAGRSGIEIASGASRCPTTLGT